MAEVRKFSKKSSSHLKILGLRRVIRSELHTEDPQILGAYIVNFSVRVEVHGQPVASAALPSRL
jgi:hypothetical protein